MYSTKGITPPTISLDKETLLRYVSQESIMERIGLPVQEDEIGQKICSPFRSDNTPGCKLRYSADGRLYFFDFADNKRLDCFGCVQEKYNLSFPQALQWVYDTFIEGKEGNLVAVEKVAPSPPKVSRIQVASRPFTAADYAWWEQGVSKEELRLGRVIPLQGYWVNGRYFACFQPSYAYQEEDGYKLYFPHAEKGFRFLGNTKVLSCYELLPQTGELLVITSSKKDALCLRTCGFWAVAPQGEGMDIAAHLLWELKQRFTRLVIFYDNDEAGIAYATSKVAAWGVDSFVHLPLNGAKDPFAYCSLHGVEAATQQFNTLLT